MVGYSSLQFIALVYFSQMKSSLVVALFLTFSLESFGLAPKFIRSNDLSSCSSAVEVNSTIINVGGNEVRKSTFTCPDGTWSSDSGIAEIVAPSARSIAIPLDSSSELSQRSAVECRNPSPECQCGLETQCFCTQQTPNGPSPNDCQIILDSLSIIPQIDGPTFIVPPLSFQLIQFQSCALQWDNELTTGPLEYCYDELHSMASQGSENCFTGAGTGVLCNVSNHNWWRMEMFRVQI
ncbi:hypothetical protein ACEPAG_2865 [Sanghuangporus baumii]